MVERKLYKTKLCMLYQRGRCSRQYCNFAHGSAELRRSFNGRESNRGGSDLRERLDRMHSPSRSSLGRGDANARHTYRGDSPYSTGKRMERNHRKRKQLDGNSDHSGRVSDGNDDHIKVRKQTSSDTRMRVSEQLREMQSQIKRVQNDKRELEMYLEDRAKEADTLSMKIHELEVQLSKEKEESKKFTAKIKKFIKAHNRHLRLQDDLKRSHAQLQKLGEQLGLDAVGPVTEDNPKINTFNDDMTGGYAISPLNEGQMNSSPPRRRARVFLDTYDASDQVGERMDPGKYIVEKLSRQPMDHGELSNGRIPESDYDEYNMDGSLAYEDKSNRVNETPDFASTGKYKVSETGVTLPSTGIAAHAVDDVEVVEVDDALPANGANSAEAETEATLKIPNLPFPPPPPPSIPRDVYSQYKGEDESVDIDGIDEELVEVDIV